MLSLSGEDLQSLIQEAQNDTQGPMIYKLSRNKERPLWETHTSNTQGNL